ncbi:hypothetical protein [Anaerosporobacter sp.]
MNLLQTPLTLLEIEHLLEKELMDEKKGLRIVSDLNLTYEEYCFLSLKAKGLQRYDSDLIMLEKYRAVILVSWVFSLRYGNMEKVNYSKMCNKINNLQQHIMRKTINLIAETFDENGINTYGKDIYTLEGLFSLIGIHAGIPEKLHNKLFGLLDESLKYQDMTVFEEKFKSDLEPRMTEIFEYMDEETVGKIIHETRDIFIDCRVNNLALEELMEKYTSASKKILENCVHWCEEMKYYQDQKQVVFK